jgi:hypothetical protein
MTTLVCLLGRHYVQMEQFLDFRDICYPESFSESCVFSRFTCFIVAVVVVVRYLQAKCDDADYCSTRFTEIASKKL